MKIQMYNLVPCFRVPTARLAGSISFGVSWEWITREFIIRSMRQYTTDKKYITGIFNDCYRHKSMEAAIGTQYAF